MTVEVFGFAPMPNEVLNSAVLLALFLRDAFCLASGTAVFFIRSRGVDGAGAFEVNATPLGFFTLSEDTFDAAALVLGGFGGLIAGVGSC